MSFRHLLSLTAFAVGALVRRSGQVIEMSDRASQSQLNRMLSVWAATT